MDVSGVSPTAGTPQTQEPVQTTSATSAAIGGDGTIGSLPKPLIDAICQSIAYSVCSTVNRSNQRIHVIMKEAEQR
jgi:hypothetical protein